MTAELGGPGDRGTSDQMRVSVRPGAVGTAALSRLIGIAAARAQLTVDVVDQAMEIAAILAGHAPAELAAGAARLDVAAQSSHGRLVLRVGVLRDGGADRVIAAGNGRGTIGELAVAGADAAGPEGEQITIELVAAAHDVSPPAAEGSTPFVSDASPEEQTTIDFVISTGHDPSGAHVVAIRGDVDIFTAPSVKLAAREAVFAGSRYIVLDLTDTTFLDSTGLGVIIGLARLVRPDGEIAIVNVNPTITKTLQITGLDDIFVVRPTLAEALAALERP
jgi:anti-sigma B factor antagonist